jgi:hypothetical protein
MRRSIQAARPSAPSMDLDCAHGQVFVAVVDHSPTRQLLRTPASTNHHPEPRLQLAGIDHPLERSTSVADPAS